MIGFPIRKVGKLPVARRNRRATCPIIPDRAKDWPMWEKCVGCGEGLFTGDAFCGNCGRPVAPAVPAAREPGGLAAARLASSPADRAQVRVVPAARRAGVPGQADPGQANREQADPEQADPEQASPEQADPEQADPEQSGPENTAALDTPVLPYGPASHDARRHPGGPAQPANRSRRNGATRRDRVHPHEGASRHEAVARSGAPEPGRRGAPKLSGPATLDPVRNPRCLKYVLRQAAYSPASTCSLRRSCCCASCSAPRLERSSAPLSDWNWTACGCSRWRWPSRSG